MGAQRGLICPQNNLNFAVVKFFFDGSPYQTLDIMLMTTVLVVVIVAMMMMVRVTVEGVVERCSDVCAHEQPICQTPHVITTTVTHSASTKQTFSSLVKKKYNTETHSASTEQTFSLFFYQ